MTEQENPPPWLMRPRRAWKPRHSQLIPRKSKNGAALVLSAVAIAIARRQVLGFMAGETAGNRANGNQRCAGDATDRLAKAQESQKAELEEIIKNKRRS